MKQRKRQFGCRYYRWWWCRYNNVRIRYLFEISLYNFQIQLRI